MAHAAIPDLTLELSTLLSPAQLRRPEGHQARFAATVVEPATAEEVSSLVRKAESRRLTLAPMAGGRTLALIRPRPVDIAVSMVSMDRVLDYQPDDMTVVVEAGITLAKLNDLLAERGQYLPADPPQPESVTVGSLIGGFKAGPLRLSAGTVRDLLIGVQFAGHGGRLVRGGGRVVKNVAGYDLMKLMVGSYGTLGIVTEAIFKVHPLPEHRALAAIGFPDRKSGFEGGFALLDRFTPSYLDLLSPGLLPELGSGYLLIAGAAGNREQVGFQLNTLASLSNNTLVFEGDKADRAYVSLRDLALPETSLHAQISVPMAALPQCLAVPDIAFRAHVGSGIAQVALTGERQSAERGFRMMRQEAAQARGQCRMVAGSAYRPAAVPVFDQPSPGALALMRRLKQAFDPAGVFNPNCFVGGI